MKIELTHLFGPKADESPLGYYRRLAEANALWSWKDLASMIQVSASRTGLLGSPDHVAAKLGIPAAWTGGLAQREQHLRALRSLHRSRTDAVCPECLAEDIYLRVSWEHAYVTACSKHRLRLVDHCSACGDSLSPHRERLAQCRCGTMLMQLRSMPATDAQMWLSSLLSTEGTHSGEVTPDVTGVKPDDLSHLVRVLCHWFDVKGVAPRRNAAGPGSVSEAVEFLKPLEQLLADWPSSFMGHVSTRIAAGPEQARTLKARLGYWYQQLFSVAQKGPLKVFMLPVISVANKEFDGAIAMDDGARWEDLGYVRLSDAARKFRVGISALRRAVTNNQLAHRVCRYGTKGKVFQVLRTDVEDMVRARAGWISEADACKRLGVGQKVLANMAAAGLLEADFEWLRDAFKGGPVRVGAVETLSEKLLQQQAETAPDGERIAFRDLTSRRLGDNTAIQNLMRAILSGEVLAQGPASDVGLLQYTLADVRSYFGTPLLEAGLSIHQLTKLTGWKHESIDHWIETGLLGSHPIVLRGQPCRVVMPAQLLAFNRTYMPLSDVAKLAGSRPSYVAKRLAQIGVVAGKTTSSGAQRGMLVRLSDVVDLAMKTANSEALAVVDACSGRKGSPT